MHKPGIQFLKRIELASLRHPLQSGKKRRRRIIPAGSSPMRNDGTHSLSVYLVLFRHPFVDSDQESYKCIQGDRQVILASSSRSRWSATIGTDEPDTLETPGRQSWRIFILVLFVFLRKAKLFHNHQGIKDGSTPNTAQTTICISHV